MSSRQHPPSDHQQMYQLNDARYSAAFQRTGNPAQSNTFASYESHSPSTSVSYEGTSQAYGCHLDPSNPSSPALSHRPTQASPVLASTFFLPSHPETISPTAIYQHQPQSYPLHEEHQTRARSHSHPHPHSHSQSRSHEVLRPLASAFPSYEYSAVSTEQYQEDCRLPDPHTSHHRPQLSISVSSGVVGHPEGWNDSIQPMSATSEFSHPEPTPSPRLRTTSLGGKKKKASPRTAVVPLPARKRSPASCAPCRKKKLKCDRSLPCSSCVAKGTDCIWEGDATPLYIKDEHDQRGTKELQAQVDRLQALVDELVSSPKSSKTTFKLDSMTATGDASIDSSPTFELLAHDLPQALVETTLEGVLPPLQVGELALSPFGRESRSLVEEARHFSKSRSKPPALVISNLITPSSSSSSAEASPSSLVFSPLRGSAVLGTRSSPVRDSRPNEGGSLDAFPSARDIQVASDYFFDAVDVLLPLLDRTKFDQWREALRRGNEDKSELGSAHVAIVIGVSAGGLSRMTDAEALELGVAGDRRTLVRKWIDIAASALARTKFSTWPTNDSVRASLVIASIQLKLGLRDDASLYSAGVSLLATCVQAAFSLELHREPNRNGRSRYRFSECQDRRRLFWALFALCSSVTTDTGRTWPQFELRYIDTHFPLDCFDEELALDELAVRASVRARVNSEDFEETPMTYNLCLARLGFVSKKISDEAFTVNGCRYSRVVTLHSELRTLEKSLPECYRIPFDFNERGLSSSQSQTSLKAALVQISISSEIVRLNRPFLVLAAGDERYQQARERVVTHAKRVLTIATAPVCAQHFNELLLKVLASASVLGVELAQSPEEEDAETLRTLLRATSELLREQASSSLIAVQGVNIVNFLRQTIACQTSSQSTTKRRVKRARSSRQSPDEVNVQLRQSWLHSMPNTAYPSRAGSPDSDSEAVNRRKTNRPGLKHSARSESHLPTSARIATLRTPLERSHRSHSVEDLQTFDPYPLPLSPVPTATSAPSVVAFSPVIDFTSSSSPRTRTFSDPASSSLRLTELTESSNLPAPTMFRYYHPPTESHRPSFETNPHTGLGLVDISQHGGLPTTVTSVYSENCNPSPAYASEDQMDTDDFRFEHFSPDYRHS